MSQDERILNAALTYAANGWPVMPLAGAVHRGDALVCSCWKHQACISPAKHPLTPNGLFDATTDETEIRKWQDRYKVWNLGLRTGVLFDVLDVDGDAGQDSLTRTLVQAALAAGDHFPPDVGPAVTTGRGIHLFVLPTGGGNAAHIRPGIDFRGNGGYVVAPPSLHVNGTRYSWLRKGPLAPAPDWMVKLLAPDPNRCLQPMAKGECGRLDAHHHRGGIEYVDLRVSAE